MVPRPTHAVSYPDVNGTTAEITSILTKDSPTAVATCTARKTEAPRARDRCRPMTTAERIPRGGRREAVSNPSTSTTVSMAALATPVARETSRRISFMRPSPAERAIRSS